MKIMGEAVKGGGGSDGRSISRSGRILRSRTGSSSSRLAVVIRSSSSGSRSRSMIGSTVVVLNNRRYLIVLSAIRLQ